MYLLYGKDIGLNFLFTRCVLQGGNNMLFLSLYEILVIVLKYIVLIYPKSVHIDWNKCGGYAGGEMA